MQRRPTTGITELLDLLSSGGEGNEEKNMRATMSGRISEEGQRDRLDEFAKLYNTSQLKVGQYVKRTKYGKLRYKLPTEGMVAMVSKVFDPPLMMGDEEHIVTGEIIICQGTGGVILPHTVDLRYYEAVEDKEKK